MGNFPQVKDHCFNPRSRFHQQEAFAQKGIVVGRQLRRWECKRWQQKPIHGNDILHHTIYIRINHYSKFLFADDHSKHAQSCNDSVVERGDQFLHRIRRGLFENDPIDCCSNCSIFLHSKGQVSSSDVVNTSPASIFLLWNGTLMRHAVMQTTQLLHKCVLRWSYDQSFDGRCSGQRKRRCLPCSTNVSENHSSICCCSKSFWLLLNSTGKYFTFH